MTGVYLKCNSCGKTLGGEEVTDATNGLHWSQRGFLQRKAKEFGWTGEMNSNSYDLCPVCSTLKTT